jgi:hypothetical protein
MKNLHIIPTEKPSRISLHTTGIYNLACELYENSPNFSNRNIYITSDEEIKKGDWVLNLKSNGVYPIFFLNEVVGYEKKIILTTDPTLIEDGVQSIDNKFLEWFVNNPSCEKVKVSELRFFNPDTNESAHCKWEYDLPQEEPKQELPIINGSYGCTIETNKQETLEEASHTAWLNYEHVEGNLYSTSFKNGFKFGAKWQQERMYSEEDVKSILMKTDRFLKADLDIWFEQFKKK